MASFLERLLGRREPRSADVARERLKLVLVTDRSDLSPEKLEQMQGEIIQVIRRYLQIDEHQVHITLEQRERKNYLVADIPLARDHGPYIPEELRQPPVEGASPSAANGPESPEAAPASGDDTQPTKSPAAPDSESA